MTRVFLAGPIAWPPLLSKILDVTDVPAAPATILPDTQTHQATDEIWPTLASAPGARVDGVLLTLSEAEHVARLRYFAACHAMAATSCTVTTDTGPVEAVMFSRAGNAPVQAGPVTDVLWHDRWGGIVLASTEEVMDGYGRISPDKMRARMQMVLARTHSRGLAHRPAPTDVRSAMTAEQVERIRRDTPHAGFFATQDYLLRHPGFDGRMSPELRREVFVATDAAIVLPYDPVRDRVLLVEQFRMGPYGRGDPHPWVLEPVAGRVDPGEAPEQTARRECIEEAGLALHGLEHIASYYCTPGCSTEYFHCYLGLCDLPSFARGQGGLETEDEDIRTHVLSFSRAMDLCRTGEANNGPLILGLMWLERERDRLRLPG